LYNGNPFKEKSIWSQNLNLPLYGCTQEILKIIAATQIKHVFLNPQSERMGENKLHGKFSCQEGDLITGT
jgi:hypothetical protein